MKLIIDISKYTIDIAKLGNVISDADNEIVAKAIANGILLPKEHGRLIDADSLLSKFDETYRSKIGLVPDCLAEGFVQCEKLIKSQLIQDIVDLPTIVKSYTKADYIMALHKEYGVSLEMAEKAHDKALEYLRSEARMKG